MRISVNKFLFFELIFTAAVAAVGFGVFKIYYPERFFNDLFMLLVVIAVLTGAMYSALHKVAQKDMGKFATRFVMVNGIKMMVYLVGIMIYAFTFKERAVTFLISFLVLYFLYTAFSLVFLLRKKQKK